MFFPAELTKSISDQPLTERLVSLGGRQRAQVGQAAESLAQGRLVIVVSEAGLTKPGLTKPGLTQAGVDRRGRGFFLGVAALATAETVNTTIVWGRGLTCFSVTAERAMVLGLLLAGEYREGYRGPIFLRSVEAADCEGTGISAADRALTLRAAGAPDAGIASLKSPGHVMPAMIAYRGREHRASSDIALDLVRHLTDYEVPAWTDILDDDGEVAPAPYCQTLADRLGILCLGVTDAFGPDALG